VTEFERAIRALSVTLGGMAPTSVTITTDAAAGQASHWANNVNIELATRKSSSDVKN
jgi:enoyl reductase-like protein